jgi:hypothetical protein
VRRFNGEDINNLSKQRRLFRTNAVEVKKQSTTTIDFEIRDTEGPVAYFNRINGCRK